jgi:hypothetical protein
MMLAAALLYGCLLSAVAGGLTWAAWWLNAPAEREETPFQSALLCFGLWFVIGIVVYVGLQAIGVP